MIQQRGRNSDKQSLQLVGKQEQKHKLKKCRIFASVVGGDQNRAKNQVKTILQSNTNIAPYLLFKKKGNAVASARLEHVHSSQRVHVCVHKGLWGASTKPAEPTCVFRKGVCLLQSSLSPKLTNSRCVHRSAAAWYPPRGAWCRHRAQTRAKASSLSPGWWGELKSFKLDRPDSQKESLMFSGVKSFCPKSLPTDKKQRSCRVYFSWGARSLFLLQQGSHTLYRDITSQTRPFLESGWNPSLTPAGWDKITDVLSSSVESLLSSWRTDPTQQFSGSMEASFFFYAHTHLVRKHILNTGPLLHLTISANVRLRGGRRVQNGSKAAAVRAIFSCIQVSDGALNVVTAGYKKKRKRKSRPLLSAAYAEIK